MHVTNVNPQRMGVKEVVMIYTHLIAARKSQTAFARVLVVSSTIVL